MWRGITYVQTDNTYTWRDITYVQVDNTYLWRDITYVQTDNMYMWREITYIQYPLHIFASWRKCYETEKKFLQQRFCNRVRRTRNSINTAMKVYISPSFTRFVITLM